MLSLLPNLKELSDRTDILAWYRRRIIYLFAVVCTLLVLPIAISNAYIGEIFLAAGTVVMLVALWVNTAAFYMKKFRFGALSTFILLLMIVAGISMSRRGVYGIFWAYPAVLFIYFVVSRRIAQIYTAVFFGYFCSIVFTLITFGTAVRSVIALVVTILFTDIFLSIIEHLQERLIKQSNTDPLTGALNRRQLEIDLARAVERRNRSQTPASIIIFDIDHFKSINDRYGHDVGDEVLKQFASLITKRRRRLDKFYRLGGEEFLLFLPDTPATGALPLAEELRWSVCQTDFIKDRPVTVSIGISELGDAESIEKWMKRADEALYQAKKSGRNQVVSSIKPSVSTVEKKEYETIGTLTSSNA